MKRESTYSLLAITFLFVATIGLGVYARVSQNSLDAGADIIVQDLPQYNAPCRVMSTPLKVGINTFTNGEKGFSLADEVLVVGKGLISFTDAQKKGIIKSLRNISKDTTVGEAEKVDAGESFSFEVLDISSSPELCLEGIK